MVICITKYQILLKSGYESKHNMDCWSQKEYLGFGVASHSYIEGIRYSNTISADEYIENINKGNFANNKTVHEKQTKENMAKEYMLLGLRKIDGVKISEYKNKFGDNPIFAYKKEIEKLTKDDLLEIDGNYIRLTKKGLDFANIVWEEFV